MNLAIQEEARRDSSVPPLDGSSPFSKLPREIRDEVYKYALSYRHGVTARIFNNQKEHLRVVLLPPKDISKSHQRRTGDNAANPLQLVCRQLYAETVGLEYTLNHIDFETRTRVGDLQNAGRKINPNDLALSTFIRCIEQDRLRHWTYLRSISFRMHAHTYNALTKITSDPVRRFCTRNPQITLRFYLESFDLRPAHGNPVFKFNILRAMHEGLIGRGIGLQESLAEYRDIFDRIRMDFDSRSKNLPHNLRLCLKSIPSSSSDTLESILDSVRRNILSGVSDKTMREEWVKQVRKWHEEGLGHV